MKSFVIGLLAVLSFAAGARAEDAIIVLDASGSMWGQIDGKAKIEIARDVMDTLLADLPAERRLGLVAYGHRRKGDCADIESLVPVGTDRGAIAAAMKALNPKGKTPLSDAVKFAAEQLRYTEEKATVVLVSDGEETCDADPCSVGRALEDAGVGLTVHVVGFGLETEIQRAGLQCLAEATGGTYLDAANADELTGALSETVAAAPEPEPEATVARVTLRATELSGGPEVTEGLTWAIAPAGGEPVFTAQDAGTVTAEIPPGDYTVTVERPADGLKGSGAVSARAGTDRTVTIILELNFDASVTPTPSGEAPAGSDISVAWTGPDRDGDFLTVVPKDAPAQSYKSYQYTKAGNPLVISMPPEIGDYEVRYVLGRPNKVLAAEPIKATAISADLQAPDEAPVGADISVAWTGPDYDGDFVTVVEPDREPSAYKSYFYTRQGSPGAITMPAEPGVYELRYVTNNSTILARRPIAAIEASASLTAPEAAEAGSEVSVSWSGPAEEGDFITVVEPGREASAYKSYFYVKERTGSGTLEMPVKAGTYEVRYVLKNARVLTASPIDVTEPSATVEAPATAAEGATIEIVWTGPDNDRDYITVTKASSGESSYNSYKYTREGSPMALKVPGPPGDYEVRYVLAGARVIARSALTVTAP